MIRIPTCIFCEGSGKLQDPHHTWVIVECHGCDGTGIMEQKWYDYLTKNDTPKQIINEDGMTERQVKLLTEKIERRKLNHDR